MTPPTPPAAEADDRFPSGKWTGFYTYHADTRKHQMELHLTFGGGKMAGEGRDPVGEFTVSGTYHLDDGKCFFTKQYPKRHFVEYAGFNEGRGIWGTWEIKRESKGGFHIWPEAMGDPTLDVLEAEAPAPPAYVDPEPEDVREEELVPAAA